MKSRITYIESKAGGLVHPARMGRVTFSKSGTTLHYVGKSFQSLRGSGFKSNYFEVEPGEPYWISGPRKDGQDSLYCYQRRTGSGRRCSSRILVENPQSASAHRVQMKAAMALGPSVASFTYPPVLRTGSNTRPAKARRRPCTLAGSARYSATPNPSIEGTSTSGLRPLVAAPHVKR